MSSREDNRLNALERRATLSLGVVYGVRMLGLFMVLPVFALYAAELKHATPFLTGIAIGAYGLTQALLQIPLGMLSDRIGRKPVIVGGLLVFAAGSVLAAVAESMYVVIIGRAFQGAGAIAAAVMALAADLSRDEQRTKVMAALGFSIGLSFAIALIIGPLLQQWIGVPGIFWTTAGLALIAIALVLGLVPRPSGLHNRCNSVVATVSLVHVVKNPSLLRLDSSIFLLHMIMTSNFVVIPGLLRDTAGLAESWHWLLYLVVLLGSFAIMLPFLIYSERRGCMRAMLVGAILTFGVAELSLVYSASSLPALTASMLLLFVGFNLLESVLPSLTSRLSPPPIRGTSMGVYSSCQFLGVFTGGALGGMLLSVVSANAVFFCGAGTALFWAAVMLGTHNPARLSTYNLKLGPVNAERANIMTANLRQIPGVREAVVVPEDGMAYLKVDREVLDEARLREFSVSAA